MPTPSSPCRPSTWWAATDGCVESVGAWDRDGFNRVAATLAELTGGEPVLVSTPDDGLPDFKPG